MQFEVESEEPVVRVEFDLANDGALPHVVLFEAKPGDDGRYSRSHSFKPVINGVWPLQLRAWTASGAWTETTCTPGVTVTF